MVTSKRGGQVYGTWHQRECEIKMTRHLQLIMYVEGSTAHHDTSKKNGDKKEAEKGHIQESAKWAFKAQSLAQRHNVVPHV
ncbi:hypothetical protein EB796_014990 [Bugula neritina]|uniref:Uncharacterized protein n=1 Tax=Bugula neritina TaxID=10212 RepID=A0A7J7JMT7_BUGNE|nr:hypothetical protein EB796_014990 [Bugula neritina]